MKKITVLYDEQGNIISAAHAEPAPAKQKGAPVPEFGVKPGKGQKATELDVPAGYEKHELHELLDKLHVDVNAKQPSLRAKKP
ncbi:MAG TPA: hypothetical protein VN282_28345 [Pyrinomonadaceae bacterium]|nr:hypothetical protein [Pyrinomonadaceae bacterium]